MVIIFACPQVILVSKWGPWLIYSISHNAPTVVLCFIYCVYIRSSPDSKVHGANMGPIWGQQDPGGSDVGPMNLAIWVVWVYAMHVMKTPSNGNIFRVTGLCGESTGRIPWQRLVTRSFDLRLNKRLSKQSKHQWFKALSRSLWRHCNISIPFRH